MGVAAGALDPQPILPHRRQVRTARNEGHVRAGMRQSRAISASDATRADDCDPHALNLDSR
jgi:hypothetical protein